MFSRSLFKQSCKANGTMWAIITFAVCFMLACVMLISGNGNIGEVKNSIQDTIIVKEVDAQMQKRALAYYADATDGLERFDTLFSKNATDTLAYLGWYSKMPDSSAYTDETEYSAAVGAWQSARPASNSAAVQAFVADIEASMPKREAFSSDVEYAASVAEWSASLSERAVKAAYAASCEELQLYVKQRAASKNYAEGSREEQEMLGSVMYVLDPDGMFDAFYTENGEDIPESYDVTSLLTAVLTSNAEGYISSAERVSYRDGRAADGAAVFIAGNMIKPENVEALADALSSYGVTKEKYDSFGYTYESVKHMSKTAIVTYRGRLDYELELIEDKYANGEYADFDTYIVAVTDKRAELASEISSSFLSTLPSAVSEALEEIGRADLYTLVVGSIFYKLAGLLLPIIYMIMASNNLIAGQVDSGSMAYVLSTSTKRETVVFTQAVYLVGSLLAMFLLSSATGCVCLALVSEEVALTYGNLLLLNVGAFLVLFALSGLCFMTSCIFDRSKRSMAIGGGLSIFALVAAMLGLFGSPVIPSVVRLDALNYFNYVTVISLFDVISIIDGTNAFLLKFAILAILGAVGYAVGAVRFTKKDLPL